MGDLEQDNLSQKARPAAEEVEDPDLGDFWTLSAELLIRHHRVPRVKLYVPTEAESPHTTQIH